jgi:WhiB family redox-sensing transcriptional regulator
MADQAQWADQAACRDEDPALFDTVRTSKETVIDDDVETARDICADCPVMMRCLENAIRFGATDGVWGGMVDEERLAWALVNRPGWLPAAMRFQSGSEMVIVVAAA